MNYEEASAKARKLLRLAERGGTVEEAALAASKAQAIIDKFRLEKAALSLDASDEPEEEIGRWDDPLEGTRTLASWKWRVASALCRANGVFVYKTAGLGLILVGKPSNVQTVRYIFAYVVRAIDDLAKKKAGNGRTWLNNYRVGCADAVAEAVRLEKKSTEDRLRAEAHGSQALMRINTAIQRVERERGDAKQWLTKNTSVRLVFRSKSSFRLDPSARMQGQRDGRAIYCGGKRRGSLTS